MKILLENGTQRADTGIQYHLFYKYSTKKTFDKTSYILFSA